MLSQRVLIMVCYSVTPMIHNHSLSINDHDSQPIAAQHNSLLFTTTGSVYNNVIHNHWLSIVYMIHNHLLSIAHHESQPIAQLNTPNNNHWLSITQHDSQPLVQHNSP
jgi:hypothetical protein